MHFMNAFQQAVSREAVNMADNAQTHLHSAHTLVAFGSDALTSQDSQIAYTQHWPLALLSATRAL